MADKYYVGDIGTVITVDCLCTITGATNLKLKIKKPDETKVEWIPTIDGTTNLKYTVIDGDFNMAGIYYLQASLAVDGWSGLGETVDFRIYKPYT